MTQNTTMIEGTTMTDGRRMTSGYHERVTRGIFAAALILGSHAILAGNTPTSIDEVVVRGTYLQSNLMNALKSPTPILDVPQSLSIVTEHEIKQRGFTAIADLVEYLPGVTMSQGEGHRDAIVFRGVSSTADFYIDGMRDDVQYYRPLYNLSQVEILRGPNALLFGRGGTGGIVNRVTKKPSSAGAFEEVSVYGDSLGAVGIELDVNKPLTTAVSSRLNLMWEQLDNHRDYFDAERVGINPSLQIDFSDATHMHAYYEFLDHERFVDRGIPTGANGRPVQAFHEITFADTDQNLSTLTAHLLSFALEHEFSASTKGKLALFYGDYDKAYENLYVGAYDQSVSPQEVTLDGYVDAMERQNTILSGTLVNESILLGLSHRLLLGFEWIDTRSVQDRWNPFWSTTLNGQERFLIKPKMGIVAGQGINADGLLAINNYRADLNDDTHVDLGVHSLFVQDEIGLGDQLDLVVGARIDHFTIEVDNQINGERRSRTDQEITPRLGLVYKPTDTMSIYASYSESFLPRSGEQYADINGAKNKLDPDRYGNTELGFKWDLSNTLSFTTALFRVEQESPQPADSDPATLDIIESVSKGFELQLAGDITDQWSVSASYSYIDGEQVDRFGATGNRPTELPENLFAVWSHHMLSPRMGFGLGLTYQDASYINNSNTALLPSFTRIDAAFHYDLSDDTRIQINIENAADKLYFPHAHSTHQATVGTPFHARMSITTRL